MLRRLIPLLPMLSLLFVFPVFSQEIERVEPPNWWAGMKHSEVQLLVKGEEIGAVTEVSVKNGSGLKVKQIHHAENPDYLFIDLDLLDVPAGDYQLIFRKDKKKVAVYDYQIKQRTSTRDIIGNEDVLYLITPDRFSNGDTGNDSVEGLQDKLNREDRNGRHGGDLAGVMSRLDYMEDLGITTVWLNPVLENAMPEVSYHGYAITDYYKVDPRYGTNEMYSELSEALSQRGMKLIMDMVFNHCGSEHWWMKNPPSSDWVHFQDGYKVTNHAMASIPDPHGVDPDRELMQKGWFVPSMPDLNHDNPFMEEYLIQNSIWWIEYAGLEGIRMDTYPYNKKSTMQHWSERVLAEYPDFYLVGETWIGDELQEAYWAPKAEDAAYNSGLTSITDFPLCYGIHNAFGEDGDIMRLYEVLSKDFAYDAPMANKIFADNHDMDRFYHTIGESLPKFKNAMTFLFTTRGIPQFYYGTEILMRKFGEHGDLREDFPGGWKGDERDAFTAEGRTAEENEAFDHVQKLMKWRHNSEAVAKGDLKHFVAYDNIYVYSRKSANEHVVVIINNNNGDETVDLIRYEEFLKNYDSGWEVITEQKVALKGKLLMKANSSLLLVLKSN